MYICIYVIYFNIIFSRRRCTRIVPRRITDIAIAHDHHRHRRRRHKRYRFDVASRRGRRLYSGGGNRGDIPLPGTPSAAAAPRGGSCTPPRATVVDVARTRSLLRVFTTAAAAAAASSAYRPSSLPPPPP